jgi:hypothetical protein
MFQQRPEDRLRSWREFRSAISDLPLEQALSLTAEFWDGAPFAPYNLDPDQPSNWPNPWTLIYENVYCDVAKCLGIVYTLLLSKHRMTLDIEIRIYQDPQTKYVYNLAWINQGKYIINMINGEVLNIEQFDKTLQLKQTYTAVDLQLENY